MDSTPITEVSAKLLAPDILQRYQKIAKMETNFHRVSQHVDEVYNSKKSCLMNLQKQHQQLNELVSSKKRNRKALMLKRSEEYTKFVDIINKTKQLQKNKRNLVKEEETLVQDFGKTLHETDQKFLQSLNNSTDDNVAHIIGNLKKEIRSIEEEIAGNKKKQAFRFSYGYGSIPAIKEIIKDFGKNVEENYKIQRQQYEKLVNLLESNV